MKMEEMNKDKPGEHGDTILVARFSMVARDTNTGKAAQVNPLLLRDDNEKKLFQMGEGMCICRGRWTCKIAMFLLAVERICD
jgi:hypothetical protein